MSRNFLPIASKTGLPELVEGRSFLSVHPGGAQVGSEELAFDKLRQAGAEV